MNNTATANHFDALNLWFHSALGERVAHAFKTELSHCNEALYGQDLLQLGFTGESPWFDALKYRHKWTASPSLTPSPSIISDLTRLPLDSCSMDCVVLPLVIEAFSDKNALLAEVDRVLRPCGHVVLFCINPYSLWALWAKASKNSCYGGQSAYLSGIFSLQRAMLHHDYIQIYYNSFFYIPPVKSNALGKSLAIFNEIGKMVSPFPSAFYCLVLQKQVAHAIMSPLPKGLVNASVNSLSTA